MKKILFVIGVVAILVLGIYAVLKMSQNPKSNSQKITIVTTLFPLYDFAKNIGQDRVEVFLLLPPGVEAHTFEPKPSDVVKINNSDIFIYTGQFMEPWAHDIIKGISGKNVGIVDSSVGIELIKEEEQGGKQKGIDPHIWLDFDNDKIIIDNITRTISEKDPAHADFYQKNANEYKNKLTQLDTKYKTTLAKCASHEIIYGGHAAFAYMGKRYGLVFKSAYGVSPDSEPSAQELTRLVGHIKKDNIKYVFFEELVNPRVAETLVKETGAGLLILNPGHNLTKKDFEKDISFILVMEKNLTNLATGLKCSN